MNAALNAAGHLGFKLPDALTTFGFRMGRGLKFFVLLVAGAFVVPLSAQTTYTWNGGSAANSNFSSGGAGGNWSGATAPISATTSLLHFAGSTRLTPSNDQVGFTYGSITFDSGAGAFTLGGNAFTLNGVTNAVTNNSTNLQTINNGLTLGQAQTWTALNGALAFGGTINNGGFLLTLNGAYNFTFSNVISGSGGLTVNTTGGTTLLSGNNTFTGTTTLTAGTLRATTSANALGVGALQLNGGVLQLADNTGLNFARNTTVGGTTTITSDRTSAGAGTTQTLGTLSIGSNQLNITAGANVTSGTAGITFGATTLTGNPTLGVGASAQLTFGALGDGGTARTITKTDFGTLIFGSNASSLTGGSNLIVNGGIAQANTATALGTGAFNVTVNSTAASGTGAFNLNSVNQTIGTLTFGGAGAGAGATDSVATGTGTLTLGGNVTYDATNNPGDASITGKLALGASRVFTIGDSSNSAAELSISAVISGTGFGIDKQGAGTLVLSGNNSYTGTTTVTAGTLRATTSANAIGSALTLAGGALQLANDTGLNFGNATTVTGTTSVTSDRLTAGAGVTQTLGTLSIGAQTLNVTAGANVTSGTAGVTFGNTTLSATGATFAPAAGTLLTLGAVSGSGNSFTVSGAGDADLSGTISTGTGGVTYSSTGTVTLDANNSNYTGPTVINSGTVSVASVANGGTNSSLGASTNAASNLIFNGGTLLYNTNTNVNTDRLFTLGTGGFTIDAGTLGGDLKFVNTGAIAFNGTGARTLTLTGSNSGDKISLSPIIGDNGGPTSITQSGADAATLIGVNTYTGTTTVSAGSLTVNSGATMGDSTSSLVVTGGTLFLKNAAQTVASFTGTGGTVNLTPTTLTVNNTALETYTGLIVGTGSITKSGTGSLTLSNVASTYSGVTTINGGVLSVSTLANGGVASSIGNSTNVATNLILNGGTLQYTGGATSTDRLFSLGSNGGALDASGSGLLTFSNTGALAFNGQTGTRTLTLTGSNNGSLAAVLGDNSGASSLTKSGSGTWTLANAANTYTGVTTVTGGTLSVGTLANGGVNSSIGASTSAAGNLILNGGAVKYTGGAVSTDRLFSVGSSGGTLDASGSGALTMTNTGSLGFNGQTGARTLTLTGSNSGTLAAVLGDNSGASSLTKTGSGAWTLTGANTYTGTTTMSAGTLTVNSGAAIGGSTSSLLVNGGTLNLNNTAQTVASFSGTGGTVNLGSGHTLTVNDTVTEGYSGVVASSGNLVKNNTGTLTLSGNNTFSGTTTVNGGTLVAGSNTALGAATGAVTVNSGATLAMAAGVNDTKSAGLSIAGTGASGQNGALVASGATGTTGQYSGNITLTGNTTFGAANNLLIVGEGTTFTNTINLGANTLTLSTTAAVDGSTPTPTYLAYPSYILDKTQMMINSSISGTGGLIKTGPGTAMLVPASSTGSTFTGDTVITGGKLIVDAVDGKPALSSNNVYVGNASSPGAANSVTLQMGQLASPPSANNIIGVWSSGPSGTDSSATNLTIYSDGVLNMNNGSNGFKSLTLTGGHVNGQGTTPMLTLGDGGVTSNVLTTNASSQTAVIEGGRLGLASPTNSNFTVAAGSAPGGVDLRIDDIVQQGIQYTAYTDTNTSLTKLGAGKMVLTGANSYHGVTDVSAGILNIQNNVGLGAVSASLGSLDNGTIVRGGAQLQLDKGAGSDLTIGRETLTLNGTGLSSDGALRNVAGNNTYNGYIFLGSDSRINADSGTTLTIANTGGVNATIMNGATAGQNLTVGGAGNTTVNGGIASNVNNITKDGTGTLTLAGYNGYAGATNVTQGAVKVTHSNGLSGTGVTVTSGAALQFAQDATPANISVIAVGTTLNGTGVSNGGAMENLNGSNSYAGTVSLASASSIKADSGSTLTLTGGINNTVPASHQALTVGGAGNVTENGAITTGSVTTSGGKITGTGSGGTLTKVDSGTLTIGGGATSALDGITLTLGNITVSGTNTLVQSGPLSSSNAANVLTINSTNTVQSYYGSGTTTFTGVMAGGGTFEKDGAGTLAFNTSFDAQAAGLNLIISGGTVALNAGVQIKFGTIHITGNTILDFGGATSTVLQSTNLIIDPGVSVTVNNWASETDFWYATGQFYQGTTSIAAVPNATGALPENQISFQGIGSAYTTWIQTPSVHGNYSNKEIRPVPEPSTYGAIFISGALALVGWRRLRRRA